MRIYQFTVYGASPGIGGMIRVVDRDVRHARKIAEKCLEGMNARRQHFKSRELTLDTKPEIVEPFDGCGVVYAYDGEA